MPEINMLSDGELEEYQSLVFEYKKTPEDIKKLEAQKQKEPTLTWLWVLLGLFCYGISIYITLQFIDRDRFVWLFFICFYGVGVLLMLISAVAEKTGIKIYFENILLGDNLKKIKGHNNEITKQINLLKAGEATCKGKITIYEKRIVDYYEKCLDEFFLESLYNKRSGSAQFEEALQKFSSLVDEAEEIDKNVLIVNRLSYGVLDKHKKYLSKREGDNQLQKNKGDIKFSAIGKKLIDKSAPAESSAKKEYITSVERKIGGSAEKAISPESLTTPELENFKNYIASLDEKSNTVVGNETIRLTPPEVSYRAARPVDWESINNTRGLTGSRGEIIAMNMECNFLLQIGKPDLAEKVKHASKDEGDGLGYDILSYFPDGRERYIEVKSSTKADSNSFYMTRNELAFIQLNTENTVVYRIFSVNSEDKLPSLKISTGNDILNSQIIPTEYLIKL